MPTSDRAPLGQYNRRRRQLRRIATTYRKISVFRLISPREDFARLVAFVVVVVLVGVFNLMVDQTVSSLFLVGFYGAVLLAGCLAHCLVMKWSRRPWTYVSLLDGLLARYEPVDRDAYLSLQDEARRLGSIARVSLWEWLDREHQALEAATRSHIPSTAHFLDKKL